MVDVIPFNTFQNCSGALISDRHVLTSANCLQYAHAVVVILGSDDFFSGGERITCHQINIHPKFDEKLFKNDIAIITLPKRVQFTPDNRPICVPRSKIDMFNSRVAGWKRGVESIPLPFGKKYNVDKYFISNASAVPLPDDVCVNSWPRGTVHAEKQFCADNIKTQLCRGNYGAPLMSTVDKVTYVSGIFSFGMTNPCDEQKFPNVYTRVSAYSSFIDKFTEGEACYCNF